MSVLRHTHCLDNNFCSLLPLPIVLVALAQLTYVSNDLYLRLKQHTGCPIVHCLMSSSSHWTFFWPQLTSQRTFLLCRLTSFLHPQPSSHWTFFQPWLTSLISTLFYKLFLLLDLILSHWTFFQAQLTSLISTLFYKLFLSLDLLLLTLAYISMNIPVAPFDEFFTLNPPLIGPSFSLDLHLSLAHCFTSSLHSCIW